MSSRDLRMDLRKDSRMTPGDLRPANLQPARLAVANLSLVGAGPGDSGRPG